MLNSSIRSLCRDLTEALAEENRHAESAVIQSDYLDNSEEAIATLIAGRCWSDAERMIRRANRADLRQTHLLPALKEAADAALKAVESRRESLQTQLARLRVVLDTKQKVAAGLYDEVDVNVEDADLYSDTTSLAPASTANVTKKSNPASLKTRCS